MKKNAKKLIVMLGIVMGFSTMAITIQLGVWGWIPIEFYAEYEKECNKIPNAYFYDNNIGSPDGILSIHGICDCNVGYVIDHENTACVRKTE